MARKIINRGTKDNPQTGDSLYVGAEKINDNFEELYNSGGGISEAPIDGKQYARKDADWSEVEATSSGDMEKVTYDPNLKESDAFDMTNMVEGTDANILTDVERSEIAANTAKVGITTQQAAYIEANNNKINDVISGVNISIDKTDPLNPIISSTGGGYSTYDTNILDFVSDETTKSKIIAYDDTQDATIVTQAVNDAFNYCKANGIKSLYATNGLYKIDSVSVDALNDFYFNGNGSKFLYNSGDSIFKFTNCNNFFISGFNFTSNASSYADVSFIKVIKGCSFFKIDSNIFTNFQKSAIEGYDFYFDGVQAFRGIEILNNIFLDAPSYSNVLQTAITLGNGGEYSKIVLNDFRNIPSACRLIGSANNLFAFNNCIKINADDDLYSFDKAVIYCDYDFNSGKTDISYNKINHTKTSITAIICKGDPTKPQNPFTISNNDLLVNGDNSIVNYHSIYLDSAPFSIVDSNKIRAFSSGLGTGIFINDSQGCVITKNNLRDWLYGVSLNGTSSDVVYENQIISGVVNTYSFSDSGSFFSNDRIVLSASDLTEDITTGNRKAYIIAPYDLYINQTFANSITSPTGSNIIIDIRVDYVTIFSNPLTIDIGDMNSRDSSSQSVISDGYVAEGSIITIDFTQVGSGDTGQAIQIDLNVTKL